MDSPPGYQQPKGSADPSAELPGITFIGLIYLENVVSCAYWIMFVQISDLVFKGAVLCVYWEHSVIL